MELFSYLLKATACMAALYFLFRLALKNLTFFGANRMYLLVSVLLSMTIPLLTIPIPGNLQQSVSEVPLGTVAAKPNPDNFPLLRPVASEINWELLFKTAYWSIAVIMLIRMCISIAAILYKKKRFAEKENGSYFIYDQKTPVSSFFNIIFISKQGSTDEQIVMHERLHNRFIHSADRIFIQLVQAFFWFNPVIYFVKRDLLRIHEYQVDTQLIKNHRRESYAALLLQLAGNPAHLLATNFSSGTLESRIKMMFSPSSVRSKKWLYVLSVPVVIAALYFQTTTRAYAASSLPDEFTLVLDAGHGGKDAGVISESGIQEKNINLQMVLQVKSEAESRGIRVVLTRSTDGFIPLKDRIYPDASLFVSLHTYATAEQKGIEIVYCQLNAKAGESYKLAKTLQNGLRQLSPGNAEPAITNKNVYVLRENPLSSVLIELGNLNNEPERDLLMNTAKQKIIAKSLVASLLSYRQH